MSASRNLLLIFIILAFQGCTNRVITDYENCASKELLFEFKDNLNLYLIDDSKGTYKYSSMNFLEDEHYICIEKKDECIKNYTGQYYQGWKLIPISSKRFHLTGKYKTNEPNAILGAFAPDTFALQIEIDGIKAWLSVYELSDTSNLKKSSVKSVQELNKNRRLATDWNDWMTIFECPNSNVKEKSRERIWFD